MNIAEKIEQWAGEKIVSRNSVGGGSIASTQSIQTESGKVYFLKTGASHKNMFPCEAHGLQELEKAGAIKVPHVFHVDDSFLLIEQIKTGRTAGDFFEKFGQQFAGLHRFKGERFGFYEDNFIGHTPQLNDATSEQSQNWIEFYFEKRLRYQFKLAEKNGYAAGNLSRAFNQIESKIDSILAGSENEPVLLHGDLWSGNYLADQNNNPVIIDPAVYYGNREADLAMTKLFGGFSPRFYDAYNEAYPLPDGYNYRENIYKLYHVLNHLNLFGMGYHNQAVSLLQSYL